MNLKDIFKMEMYKNFRDKPYIIMIFALATIAALTSIVALNLPPLFDNLMMWGEPEPYVNFLWMLFLFLVFFLTLGGTLFAILYPFHLMNVDYKNKVMSLVFSSGVDRTNYYFVRIGATILSCFLASLIIFFIPALLFLVFKTSDFSSFMGYFFTEFRLLDILPFLLSTIFSLISMIVTLCAAVILTRGKVSGIFLYFGFSFGVSIFNNIILTMVRATQGSWFISPALQFNTMSVLYVCASLLFGWVGLSTLKKQDL